MTVSTFLGYSSKNRVSYKNCNFLRSMSRCKGSEMKYFQSRKGIRNQINYLVDIDFEPKGCCKNRLAFIYGYRKFCQESKQKLRTLTCTPICILYRCRLMSRHAIFAPLTDVGIACDARTQLSA